MPPGKAVQGKAVQGKAVQGKTASARRPAARAAGVFEALGEPVRRRILELLAEGERPVGPLVAALRSLAPISQPAVSQHLKVLLAAGLVSVRAAGTRRLYALDTEGLDAARMWLDRLADPLAPFAQPLDALATEVARGRRARGSDRAEHPPDVEHPPDAEHSLDAEHPPDAEHSLDAEHPPDAEEPPDVADRRPA